jgi:MFS family permease
MGLTALGYPAFVTFFSANLTSNASWFIFGAALNTYIFQVTGSAQAVGIASFIYSLPFAVFMLHAGLLADRFRRGVCHVAMHGRAQADPLLGGHGAFLLPTAPILPWHRPAHQNPLPLRRQRHEFF